MYVQLFYPIPCIYMHLHVAISPIHIAVAMHIVITFFHCLLAHWLYSYHIANIINIVLHKTCIISHFTIYSYSYYIYI